MDATLVENLLGGMGLFLMGMWLLSDGLKLAGGRALRSILSRGTGTPLRGLLSGAFIQRDHGDHPHRRRRRRGAAGCSSCMLRAGTLGEMPVRRMVAHLDLYSSMRRLAEQAEKGARYLDGLRAFSTPPQSEK